MNDIVPPPYPRWCSTESTAGHGNHAGKLKDPMPYPRNNDSLKTAPAQKECHAFPACGDSERRDSSAQAKMDETYKTAFYEAMARSLSVFDPMFTPTFLLDNKTKYDVDYIKKIISDDFLDGVEKNPCALTGRCFMLAREASYVLHENGIRHYLTIGNVLVDGKPYYKTTIDSLMADVKNGYTCDEIVNAHVWLTLDSGQVLDLTMLSSIGHKNDKHKSSIYDAVYVSSDCKDDALVHVPMLAGFGYNLKVVTHPDLNSSWFDAYSEWWLDYLHNFHYQKAAQ